MIESRIAVRTATTAINASASSGQPIEPALGIARS